LVPSGGGDPEPVWFRFSQNHVAAIEEEFGGVIAFDESFVVRGATTIRKVLAIVLGEPLDTEGLARIGDRMLAEEFPAYLAAIESAWLLAHGSSEEEAGKAWAGRLELAANGTASVAAAFQKILDRSVTASTGNNGSRAGRRQGTAPKSSGG
jgi:hypothetical protein